MKPEDKQQSDSDDSFKHSRLYQQLLSEQNEILKHKWIESEKSGHDIGYERALIDWIRHHREGWRAVSQKNKGSEGSQKTE